MSAHSAFATPAALVAAPRTARLSTCQRAVIRRTRVRMTAAAPPSPSLADCKQTLYDAVAPLEYGRTSLDDEEKQAEIDALIVELEQRNPTDNPADHPLREGRWRLVYTNSPIVLGRDRPGFSRPQTCWQVLEMDEGEDVGVVRNEEKGVANLFGMKLGWRNEIVGEVKALKGERLRLRFQSFKLGKFISVPFPGPIVGWQDQTFLDDQLRVARTHYGNVFVLERDE